MLHCPYPCSQHFLHNVLRPPIFVLIRNSCHYCLMFISYIPLIRSKKRKKNGKEVAPNKIWNTWNKAIHVDKRKINLFQHWVSQPKELPQHKRCQADTSAHRANLIQAATFPTSIWQVTKWNSGLYTSCSEVVYFRYNQVNGLIPPLFGYDHFLTNASQIVIHQSPCH
jgi:hypothetical protein